MGDFAADARKAHGRAALDPLREEARSDALGLLEERALSGISVEAAESLDTPLPLFRKRLHGVVGKGESSKSLVAAHLAVTVASRGGWVLILDGEMSAGRWRSRLVSLGGRSRPNVFSLIAYQDLAHPEAMDVLNGCSDEPTLIVVDSLTRYLATRGVQSENDNLGVSRAMAPLRNVASRGPAVLLIDHAAAAAEVMVSRGATTKFNDLDLSYGFRALPAQAGWTVTATIEKDRDSLVGDRLDRHITFTKHGNDLGVSYPPPSGESHRLATGSRVRDYAAEIRRLDPPASSANDAHRRLGGHRKSVQKAYKQVLDP